jgi:hypothetical protein
VLFRHESKRRWSDCDDYVWLAISVFVNDGLLKTLLVAHLGKPNRIEVFLVPLNPVGRVLQRRMDVLVNKRNCWMLSSNFIQDQYSPRGRGLSLSRSQNDQDECKEQAR